MHIGQQLTNERHARRPKKLETGKANDEPLPKGPERSLACSKCSPDLTLWRYSTGDMHMFVSRTGSGSFACHREVLPLSPS